MVTLFGMLELNRRSLFSSQFALQTTNHNISNINTPGYSRQEALFETNYPTVTSNGILGNGVSVTTVRRATAEFYSRQIRDESARLSQWQSINNSLSEMEIVFNETNDTGMTNALAEFFESWNDLAGNPENSAFKNGVVESARMLCNKFHSMDQSMDEFEDNINQQVVDNIENFNRKLSKVAALNKKIVEMETGNKNAGDLRDERDRILMEISEIINIKVKEDKLGSVDVYIQGINVVHRAETTSLSEYYTGSGGEGLIQVVMEGSNKPLELKEGKIAGLINTRDGYLKDARESLDFLAEVLIEKTNRIHSRGWTPQGSGFDFFRGDDAGTISVSTPINDNCNLVATSYDGAVGDNSLANDICDLTTEEISPENSMTINDYYESVVAAIGIQTRNSGEMVKNEELILQSLEMRKESITGVNMDEELMNLTRYQSSYEAAARVTQVVDSLVQTVLNMPLGG